jgi:hypothetical protein
MTSPLLADEKLSLQLFMSYNTCDSTSFILAGYRFHVHNDVIPGQYLMDSWLPFISNICLPPSKLSEP